MIAQMIYVQTWNDRRPGETDRARVTGYKKRHKRDEQDEIVRSLLASEKQRCLQYSVMSTKVKKLQGLDGRFYSTKFDEAIFDTLIKH